LDFQKAFALSNSSSSIKETQTTATTNDEKSEVEILTKSKNTSVDNARLQISIEEARNLPRLVQVSKIQLKLIHPGFTV